MKGMPLTSSKVRTKKQNKKTKVNINVRFKVIDEKME